MKSSFQNDSHDDPSIIRDLSLSQKQRLTELLDKYLSSLENGVPANVEAMMAENEDISEPLSSYIDQLESLHQVAAGFADPHDDERRPSASDDSNSDEQRLGDFILQGEIGRGGMGVVYKARQISLDRQVALKLLPFAAVLDQTQIARFKNEAQAAAQLCHPNIVPVYAVGAERGVNYYAMQLIDGQPLDKAIAELRGEPTSLVCPPTSEWSSKEGSSAAAPTTPRDAATRVTTTQSNLLTNGANSPNYYRTVAQLGIQAADALHTAHEYGVVHRDIKPSNLLLDKTGKLWITDFGLARCQSDVSLTKSGDLLGTMRYMSPEQALVRPAFVDHRTDVYSLGVTLYELITLKPAFDGENGAAMLRQIEQDEPVRPRLIRADLPVDLETVVLKGMSKEKDDRYETAAEFAADLQRFLDGKPTVAKPPTIVDRVGKWASRHRRSVAASASITALLLIGVTIASAMIAHERVKTEEHRKFSLDAGSFGMQLSEKLATIPGTESVRRDFVMESLKYYRKIASQEGDDPKVRAETALSLNQIGMLHNQLHEADKAIEAFEQAVMLYRQLIKDEPGVPSHRRHFAICHNNLGMVYADQSDMSAAKAAYEQALRIQTELVARRTDDWQARSDLALTQNNLGKLLAQSGDLRNAEQCFRTAIKGQRAVVAAAADIECARTLASFYKNLSSVIKKDRPDQALLANHEAMETYTSLVEQQPDVREHRYLLALAHNNLGSIQSHIGDLDSAAKSHLKAIDMLRPLAATDTANRDFLADLSLCNHDFALVETKRQHINSALSAFRTAIQLQERLVQQYPTDVHYLNNLGGIYNNLGIVLEGANQLTRAELAFASAVHYQKKAFDAVPNWNRFREFLSNHLVNYGRILRRLNKPEEAAEMALQRKQLWAHDAERLLSVAEEFALIVHSMDGAQNKIADAHVETYADAAVATLRQAQAAGWKPDLDMPAAFDVLKSNSGYQTLIKY